MKHTLIGFLALSGGIFALDQSIKNRIEQTPPAQFPRKVEYPAASCGIFHPRGSRQISVQARLLGSLPAGINHCEKIPVTLHRSHNQGIFMNMLEGHPKAVAGLSSGALGLFSLAYLPALWKKCSALYMAGAALITGGALSNVYDHLKRGYVIDYFSLPIKPIRHVIFNIGDFSIFAGLFAFLWDQIHC